MGEVKKRIFVGNLPSKVTETSIRNKFGKFGSVSNIEIKESSDVSVPSCYAFLDLETDTTRLDSCFRNLSRENWNGLPMKLEFAKESFLTRLQKERQEANAISCQESAPKKRHSAKSYDLLNSAYQHISYKNKKKHFDDDDDNDCSAEIKPGFIDNDHQKGINPTSIGTVSEDSFLQKFESFSDVWKDPPTFGNQKRNRNYDNAEYSSFQIVPQKQIREDLNTDDLSSKCEGKAVNKKTNHSEEKRLKSVQERKRTFLQQKEAVKLALASVDSKVKNNRRIIFHDDLNDETGYSDNVEQFVKSNNTASKSRHGPQLFEDDGIEEEQDYDFNIRKQFEGKKGQRLLDLQSRYANDKRFTLDDRFYESDDSADNDEGEGPPKEGSIEEERMKQLEILRSIVGDSLPRQREDKKDKSSNVDNMIVHYDPTIDDHAKYEIKEQKPKKVAASFNTRQERKLEEKRAKKKQKKDLLTPILPTVSQEKFYKVSENLKESLKSDGKSFSLLEAFGSIDERKQSSSIEDEYSCVTASKRKSHDLSSNPFKWDSSDSEDETEDTSAVPALSFPQNQNRVEAPVGAQRMWRENFFLRANDERLSEGLKFFSQGETLNEDFSQRRRHVQRILSAKVRKNTHRNTSFKIGRGGRQSKKFIRR